MPLIELEAEITKDFELRLLPSLDTLKVKDKKDRGTITIKVEVYLRYVFVHHNQVFMLSTQFVFHFMTFRVEDLCMLGKGLPDVFTGIGGFSSATV